MITNGSIGPERRVLIVEDSDDHADLTMRAIPCDAGYTVDRVASIAELHDVAASGRFDIVILDLELPDSTGQDTIGSVQSMLPDAAIIVVTSEDSDQTGQLAVAAGAQDFLPKSELATAPIHRILRYAIERQLILNTNARLTEDLHQTNEALQVAKREAEAASEARSRFLATMSHEIRTPLAAVLGYTDVAQETDGVQTDALALDALRTVRRNGDHLLALVNDVLDVAKIDANSMTLETIPMSIHELIDEVADLLGSQFDAKGITLAISIDDSVPEQLLGDPVRVRQVLLNLVGNALKFTSEGSVRIEARSVHEQNGKHRLCIGIIDTGIGMDPEQLARIQRCAPFVQADSTHAREFGGTGLGLSISRSLADLMGGRLSITSEHGVGTICRFEFVAQHAEATTPQAAGYEGARGQRLRGLGVLIIDDSADMRRLIKHRLVQSGATVHEATSGPEALAYVTEIGTSSIDTILLDMQMPVMDGLDTARHLRAMGVSTPIIMVSAHNSSAVRVLCADAGCDDFHTKPIAHEQLIEQIRGTVELRAA